MVREQKRAGAESKNAYELRAVVYIWIYRHYAICFFFFLKNGFQMHHSFVTFPRAVNLSKARAVNILRQRKAAIILDP